MTPQTTPEVETPRAKDGEEEGEETTLTLEEAMVRLGFAKPARVVQTAEVERSVLDVDWSTETEGKSTEELGDRALEIAGGVSET